MSWKITVGGTPAAIAGVAPSLDYRFSIDQSEVDAVTLTDKLTFARAATAAFTDPNGNLKLAGANVPRFNHDSSSKQSLGLLVEPSRTNLFTDSLFSTTSGLSIDSCNVALNAGTAPDGTQTAMRVTATGNVPQIIKNLVASSGIYTCSIFVKYVSGSGRFTLAINSSPYYGIYDVDLLTTSAYQRFTDGWMRLYFTFSSSAVPAPLVFFDYSNGLVNSGDVVLVWGAQIELGSTVSSFIPTQASAVVRSETATISLAGLPATRTLVEKPIGCATVDGDLLILNSNFTVQRVMVFPASLTNDQITAIRAAM